MYLCFVIPVVILICYICYKWCHDNVQGIGIDDAPTLKTKILVQCSCKRKFRAQSSFMQNIENYLLGKNHR